ncbi:MAG: pilus assembly protein [Acidobacteriota bacterium]|nr:pilus assembly protein [Acidobacteriota bacterium]
MKRRGNTILEAAMFIPVIVLLLVGMEQIGKITYTYYTLRKTLYTAARYVGTQQGVNFCDAADPAITAAKFLALTGTTDNTAMPLIPDLTADMIQVQVERYDPDSQTLGVCECSPTGCDAAAGGGEPDFVVVSIPDGYNVMPRIPFLTLDPIPLKPQVKVPFGGT